MEKRLEDLRRKMEEAFINDGPDFLKLSQELDELILEEQKAINLKTSSMCNFKKKEVCNGVHAI
jgi:hypothetical protein